MGSSIWFLVIFIVSDTDVKTALFPAPSYEYNNQNVCMSVGKKLSDDLALVGEGKLKVYYNCQEIPTEKIMKALPRV